MADIDFPVYLPGPEGGTFEETSVDPWVQDQSEVGAPRRRKRFTRGLRRFTFQMRMSGAQAQALSSFYDDTLSDGVLAFNWKHPLTGAIYLVRLAARPKLKHFSADVWDTDIALDEI